MRSSDRRRSAQRTFRTPRGVAGDLHYSSRAGAEAGGKAQAGQENSCARLHAPASGLRSHCQGDSQDPDRTAREEPHRMSEK